MTRSHLTAPSHDSTYELPSNGDLSSEQAWDAMVGLRRNSAATISGRVIDGPMAWWALERLRQRTVVSPCACWIFTGGTRNGYPIVSVLNIGTYGHRLAFASASGTDPDKHDVCHDCDMPPCWNPAHLFVGTRQVNVADCWAKGRGSQPPRITGERHHLARLTDSEVDTIRVSKAPQREIAAEFGCSQSTVWRIRHLRVRT